MRLRILRATMTSEGVVGPGHILEQASEDEGAALLRLGKAEVIQGETVGGDPPEPKGPAVDAGAPAPRHGDRKPRRTR